MCLNDLFHLRGTTNPLDAQEAVWEALQVEVSPALLQENDRVNKPEDQPVTPVKVIPQ